VKVFLNPVVVRGLMVLLAGMAAFAIGAFVIHRYRKSLGNEADSISQPPLADDGLPIHAYHAVIQQLKQQKHELTAQQLSERRKARASDTLSSVVLANLSSGVLFFNTSGLLRQANPAARHLLGFASPIGMSLGELFRTATVRGVPGMQVANGTNLLEALSPALTGKCTVRGLRFDFRAPDASQRTLELTVAPVLGEDTRLLGTTLLITDKTEITNFKQDEQARCELTGEMALAVRTSITTICGYAQQLSESSHSESVSQLAADISSEAAQIDHTLGSFLAEAKGAAAGS
jgi:PAS domain-containing protein